jgi:hypothetical protein
LEELPEIEETMVGLEELSLKKCRRLKTIPSSIGNLSKLLKIDLTYCESLETFPSSIFKLKLTVLDFRGCSMLRTFPEILEPAESFVRINLTDTAIKDLPSSLEYLVGLQILNLEGSSIVNLPESMAHLSSLKSLNLNGCKLLECVPKLPPNLTHVWAFDCPSIKRMVLNSRWKLMSDFKECIFGFGLTNNQELDGTSWSDIVAEAYFKITDDAYRSVVFCYPGSAVPRWFHYCCKGQSVTMKKHSPDFCSKNRLIGFAQCVVLDHTRTRCNGFQYKFEFISDGETYSSNGCVPDGILDRNSPHRFLNQDHIITWKFKLDLDTVGNKLFHAQNFTFQFQSDFKVKELGMCPMYTKSIEEASGSNAAE